MASRTSIVYDADAGPLLAATAKSTQAIREQSEAVKKSADTMRQEYLATVRAAKDAGASQEELTAITKRYAAALQALKDTAPEMQRRGRTLEDASTSVRRAFVAEAQASARAEEAARTKSRADELARIQTDLRARSEENLTHKITERQAVSALDRTIMDGRPGLRAMENATMMIPGAGAVAGAAFSVVGVLAFAQAAHQGYEEIRQLVKAAHELPDAVRDGFAELTSSQITENDQLRRTVHEMDNLIAKMEHKPQNGAALAVDDLRIMVDTLAEHAGKAYEAIEKLLHEKKVGTFDNLIMGMGSSDQIDASILSHAREYKKLQQDLMRMVHSGASPDELNVQRGRIENSRADTLKFLDDEEKKRTGQERMVWQNSRTGARVDRMVPYSELHGNQDRNLEAIRGTRDYIYADQDYDQLMHKKAADEPVIARLRTNKDLDSEAEKAQRKQWEETQKRFDAYQSQRSSSVDLATGLTPDGLTPKAQEDLEIGAWWAKQTESFKKGSENYEKAKDESNKALARFNEQTVQETQKTAELLSEMGRDSEASIGKDQTSGVEALARATAQWVQEVVKGSDAHQKSSRAIEDESIKIAEQSGAISRRQALREEAVVREQRYQEDRAKLVDSRAQANDPTHFANSFDQKSTQARLDDQIQNLDDQHYLQKIESDAAIAGATWGGALKKANAEFVLNAEDTAKQVVDIYHSAITGLNADLVNTLMTAGTRGHRHPGRELERSVGTTVRGLGGQVANIGLQRAEASVLGTFGMSTKADGSQASPFFVKVVGYQANMAGLQGQADKELQGALNTQLGKSDGKMSGPLSFFGKAAGLLVTGAFASGGPITAPGSYLVGERGAEIVSIGASSGYVTPNNKLSSFGGDTHHHNYMIDARGAHDPAAVRAQVKQGIIEAAPHIIAASQAFGKDQRSRIPTSMRG